MKKTTSLILVLSMLLALMTCFAVTATAEEPDLPKWVNKNGVVTDQAAYRYYYYTADYANNQNANPNADTSTMDLTFKNVFSFNIGSADTLMKSSNTAYKTGMEAKGYTKDSTFYDMEYTTSLPGLANHYVGIASAHVSSGALTDNCRATGDFYGLAYHVAVGVTFVAPYSGTMDITYQLAAWSGSLDGTNLLIGTNDCAIGPDGVTAGNDLTVSLSGKAAGNFTQYTASITVERGDLVYFMLDTTRGATTNVMMYINEVEYTSVTEAPATTGTAEVIGHSIAALDTPTVRFYVQYAEAPDVAVATLKVGNDAAKVVNGTIYTGTGPDGTAFTANDHVYVFSISVAARQMTDEIVISIKNDESEELLTANNTYSVDEYCQTQITAYKAAGAGATAEQTKLAKTCTSILMYGRSAQTYFNYNTDKLPQIDAGLLDLIVADAKA